MQVMEQTVSPGQGSAAAGRPLRITILSDNMQFSGGRVVLFGYGDYLRSQGHDVEILTLSQAGRLSETFPSRVVRGFTPRDVPPADLLVASVPRVVREAVRNHCGPVVHFCQGFPIADLEQRLTEGVVPVRHRRAGIGQALRMWSKRRTWRRKLRRLDQTYRLPASLVASSPHLQQTLRERYGKPVALCGYGIDHHVFHADERDVVERFSSERPCRVICVGSWEITFKGIVETTAAVRMAKSQGLPVEFVRVSATPCHPEEAAAGVFDTFHESLTPEQLAAELRQSDVYISNSLEAEGFGLPAMEALSCGVPSILSDIPSYRGFSSRRDFCRFVPQCTPEATTQALAKLIQAPVAERESLRHNALEVAADYTHDRACARFAETMVALATARQQQRAA